MSKKRVWKVLLAADLALPLAACSGSTSNADAQDAMELYGCNVINVYNWGEYIGENTIADFEAAYNAKVNYDLFDSNETMYTKLLGGSSYDVLIPSDYMIEKLIAEDMLQPLDLEQMTNLDQLSEEVTAMQATYDPNGEYSVPYLWGSVGLVYDTTVVEPDLIEEKGWDILLDTDFAGNIFMYDSQRDSFMVAFKALGYSMNTDNTDEIQAAYEWLQQVHETMDPAYVTDEVIDEMVNGSKAIAVMYSGDAAYVLSQNPDMAYLEPSQGTNIWSDAMVIPANASCPGLANAYINFVTGYEEALDISETVGYTSANQQVIDELSSGSGMYSGISAYLPREGYEKDEVFRYNEVLRETLSDLWNKVKIGQ